MFMLGALSQSNIDLLNGLISYWEFEEGAGTRKDKLGTNDLSTVAFDGGTRTGIVENALNSDASTIVSTPTSPTVPAGDNSWSLVFWAQPDAVPGSGGDWIAAYGKANGGAVSDYNWAVGLATTTGNYLLYGVVGGSYNLCDSGVAGSIGTWVFVHAYYDADANEWGIQINGGTPVTLAATGTPNDVTTPTFRFGGQRASVALYDGAVDQAGLWSRVLTEAEVTWLYNAGSGRSMLEIDPGVAMKSELVSWWTLDETTGTRADSHGANDLSEVGTIGYLAGKKGNCVDALFGGTSPRLEKLTTTGIVSGANSWSFACWVRMDTIASNTINTIASLSDVLFNSNDDNAWYIDYRSGTPDRFRLNIRRGTASVDSAVADTFGAASTATWYFIYCYHDAAATELGISINNGTIDTGSYTGTPNTHTGCFSLGRIGSSNTSTYYPLDGQIDEAGHWSRLLTAEEITWLYNSGVGRTYGDL